MAADCIPRAGGGAVQTTRVTAAPSLILVGFVYSVIAAMFILTSSCCCYATAMRSARLNTANKEKVSERVLKCTACQVAQDIDSHTDRP
jgi:hypothetical protein